MPPTNPVSRAAALTCKFAVRWARRACVALLAALLLLSIVARIHSAILTHRIHKVLAGLERVRPDQTTEAELVKLIPSLARDEHERHYGSSVGRYYSAKITNDRERGWLWRLASIPPFPSRWLWNPRAPNADNFPAPIRLAHWLGWRCVCFRCGVSVLDGKASSVGFGMEHDVEFAWPTDLRYISAQSRHGFRFDRALPMPVRATRDESLGFQVGPRAATSLHADFTPETPPELRAHIFNLDLSCYWGLRGCNTVRDTAPALWRDHLDIQARAMARLSSSTNPCPDRLLADRVRYLTDLNVELLEVVSSRTSPADRSAGDTLRTTYRVKELIRGRSGTSWTDVPYQSVIPSPLDRDQYIPNPVLPFLKPGEKVLAFTGAKFQSCRLVPYTQSAEWAVRSATPAPKLREDEQDEGNQ